MTRNRYGMCAALGTCAVLTLLGLCRYMPSADGRHAETTRGFVTTAAPSLAIELHQAGIRKDSSKLDALADGLQHRTAAVRLSAVLALGQIGTDRAISMLTDAKQRGSHDQTMNRVIDIALARAKSSKLSGPARVRQFVRLAGYNEAELGELLKANRHVASDRLDVDMIALHTAAEIIAEEKAAGRDMSGTISQYQFSKAELLMLDLAGMPEKKRIEILIARVWPLRIVEPDDHRIALMLADIGSPAVPAITDRLDKGMKDGIRYTEGCKMLVHILAYIGDKSAESVLTRLEQYPSPSLAVEARKALKYLRAGTRVPMAGMR